MRVPSIWPSGQRWPALIVSYSFDELARRFGIVFERLQDDLDWFTAGYFVHEKLGPVAFLRYDGEYYDDEHPDGATVYIDTQIAKSLGDSDIVAEMLELPRSAVWWKGDLRKAKLYGVEE